MTRIFPILAAAATVAFLAFSAGDASAMATVGRGGPPGGPNGGPSGPSGGPSGPSGGPSGPTGGNVTDAYIHGCTDHVDISQLTGGALVDFHRHCGWHTSGM